MKNARFSGRRQFIVSLVITMAICLFTLTCGYVRVGFAEETTNCATVNEAITIDIPCAKFSATQFRIMLVLYVNSIDPDGLYFKLSNLPIVSESVSPCAFIDNNLNINITCLSFNGSQYTLFLENYSNPFDNQGFYWKFVEDTLSNITYQSTYDLVQWGYRNNDTFYCIDIFDANWNMLYQAVECGEGVHRYSPKKLNLQSGTYNWKVWSSNGYGGDGFQGIISVITSSLPIAPSNMSATTLSSSSIKLTWTDSSNNETGFYLYRWNGSSWSNIKTLDANITSYTDSGLSAATTYLYTIQSYNSAGFSQYTQGAGNVSATTSSISGNYAGEWNGTADFGTFTLKVHNDGKSIIEFSRTYLKYKCGNTTSSGSISQSSSSSNPIESIINNKFTLPQNSATL